MRVSAVIYGIFCAAITVTGTTRPPPAPKIVGGTFTEIEKHPYMASVLYNGYHCCGGSLISDRWTLTAAHCVEKYSPTAIRYKISVGSTMASEGIVHDVVQVISHEQYKPKEKMYGDIAMIQIRGTFKFGPTVTLINMGTVERNSEDYKNCIIAGWGVTEQEDKERLQELELYTISLEECSESYTLFRSQVCVMAHKEFAAPCFGDSGGPLLCDNVQVGLLSFGSRECDRAQPEVYTSVPAYYSWVRSVLRHDGLERRLRD